MLRLQFGHVLLLGCLLVAHGCSQTQNEETPAVAGSTVPAEGVSKQASSAPATSETVKSGTAQQPTEGTSEMAAVGVADPEQMAQAEVTAADGALLASAEPTTASAAIAVIDLESFPKLPVKQQFDAQPMSIYYSTEGSVSHADEFLTKKLVEAGWKPTKHLVTSTDQYVDRLLTKDGYFIRVSISTGSSRDECAVNMFVLGNFDVRSLPRTQDAELQESTPVMAGHRSALTIPEAYDDLSQRMVDAGWQVVHEFHAPMEDVPHYRSVRFRKNAVRVNLGFVKDPAKPAEKTNIFYHAESVLPIDLPMIDHRQPIKIDSAHFSASIPWQGNRALMVELLKKHAPAFGWQLVDADDYVQEKTSVLYISVGTPVGIAARFMESAGVYYLSFERVKLPTKKASQSTDERDNKLAAADATNNAATDAASKQMKSEIEAQIAQTDGVANKLIQDELAKALGSLSGGGSKPDLQALQAQAARLQAQFGAGSDREVQLSSNSQTPSQTSAKTNVLEVPNDTEPINQEDLAIRVSEARIKLGNKDFVLKQCLSYARFEEDTPTKIIFFSDKPLLADKLDKLCASGESFMIYDGFGPSRPEVSLELRIAKNKVMMNFAADGLSLSTNSDDIQSTVRLKDSKLQGRITLTKPMALRGEALTFEATILDKVRR